MSDLICSDTSMLMMDVRDEMCGGQIVADNMKMLVTVLAILVTIILYLLT